MGSSVDMGMFPFVICSQYTPDNGGTADMISLQEWRNSAKTFRAGANEISYHDEGSGPVLVLIHGFPTCSWDWYQVWPELTKSNRCIAMDMLGFGLSDKPAPHTYSLFEQADLHEELLLTLGVSDAHILAHDYGDTVLQELLARQREGSNKIRIRSAFMLNGGIVPGQHRPRLMQRLLLSPLGRFIGPLVNERRFRRSMSAIFGPDTPPTELELQGWWEQITHKDGTRIMHLLIQYMHERRANYERWVGVLRDSPVPLRFLAGEKDPISGQHMAECFQSLGPQQDMGLLPGIGHYPQTEASEAVLKDYASFRRRHSSAN